LIFKEAEMNSFLIALQFITVIPVKKELNYSEKNIACSMLYYPLIGTFLGLVLVIINLLGTMFLPNLVRDGLILLFFVILSGGIHLDGLADSFDGLFGGKNKKEVLSIMHDSRIGVYGVLALILVLFLKFILLIELPLAQKNAALIMVPTVSRCAMVLAVFIFPYARREGMGKAYQIYLEKSQVLISVLWTVLVSLFLFFFKGALILAITAAAVWLYGRFFIKKIDGLTGDLYGALNEIMEVLILFMLILFF